LYQPLNCPILVTDPCTSEMAKYAANAFLATKISFINQIAELCASTGADVTTVATGMGLDPRIGPHFLKPGVGFGGSCLPKDTRALIALARQSALPSPLLDAVLEVNAARRGAYVETLRSALGGFAGKQVAVFGLAFKGGTSDTRESPAIDVVRSLVAEGVRVRAFDPAAQADAAQAAPGLTCCTDAYDAAAGADAIAVLTDWREFVALDWGRLRRLVRGPLVVDGRGLSIAKAAAAAGFVYVGPGDGAAAGREAPRARRDALAPPDRCATRPA
jgi:UDPglucose 6-dehydrogenase